MIGSGSPRCLWTAVHKFQGFMGLRAIFPQGLHTSDSGEVKANLFRTVFISLIYSFIIHSFFYHSLSPSDTQTHPTNLPACLLPFSAICEAVSDSQHTVLSRGSAEDKRKNPGPGVVFQRTALSVKKTHTTQINSQQTIVRGCSRGKNHRAQVLGWHSEGFNSTDLSF